MIRRALGCLVTVILFPIVYFILQTVQDVYHPGFWILLLISLPFAAVLLFAQSRIDKIYHSKRSQNRRH